MYILKFGGKSAANGNGLDRVLSIIESKYESKQDFAVILSARGNATDQLEEILDKAQKGLDFKNQWEDFKNYQTHPFPEVDFKEEFELLEKVFEGVSLIQDYSLKVKDKVLAQGEILAAKILSALLNQRGISSRWVDSRKLFVTNSNFGDAHINEIVSQKKTIEFFRDSPDKTISVITGFIASTEEDETTTLGRNGSNYSASLLAKYLDAEEVESYTNVDGVFTANPDQVEDAKSIDLLSYQEASELASFGASILHVKTIIPLIEKKIPLRIFNTFNPEFKGTLIRKDANGKGVKSISVKKDVCIINIEGKGLLGKLGIDARIFTTLKNEGISVSLISQGSSERGVGFIVSKADSKRAVTSLKHEFSAELLIKDIGLISIIPDVSVVSIVGQNLRGFTASLHALSKNNIQIILINNTIKGNNISLVVTNKDVSKAVNVIHAQIFGVSKKINIAVFGKGTVGGSLISQILKSAKKIENRKETKLNIFAIVGSKKILLDKKGITENWRNDFESSSINHNSVQTIIDYANDHHLENLIAIDNTASIDFINNYISLVENGFDLISSNKLSNTSAFDDYSTLRQTLKQYNKQYLYETNVGAGLPLIDTIKLLHDSGENITRIKGVFSGSLSYLFNTFSESDESFSGILQQAINNGFTEPDPREDLCGNDVARKLLILARELDLENEFEEIEIENLIPQNLRDGSTAEFLTNMEDINPIYESIKSKQKEGFVLRYVGELYGDLQQSKGQLKVELVSIPKSSSLGQLKGSDSIFEIYTESYGDKPIVIQGAGAGAEVTARGVFGDLLRIAEKK